MMKILIVDDSTFSQRTIANLIKRFWGNIEIYFARHRKKGFISKRMNEENTQLVCEIIRKDVNE